MRLRPCKDVAKFVPIIHVFKIDLFNRSACHDEAVVIVVANVGKLLVEHFDVLARSVFAHMSVGFNEVKLDLQRSVGEESQQVGFGHDFEGH